MVNSEQVWIGLVGVTPEPKNTLLKRARGAYVNVLAWVASASQYRTEVKRAVKQYDFKLEKIQDVEPLAQRLRNYKIPKKILRLAEKVRKDKGIYFSEFYVYPNR